MHRIDVPSATPDHLFTEGSPTGGVPATVVSDDWLNDVQENICNVIEQAGLPLTKGRKQDLTDAIRLVTAFPAGNFSTPGHKVLGDFIVAWGIIGFAAGSTATQTLSTTFPHGWLQVAGAHDSPTDSATTQITFALRGPAAAPFSTVTAGGRRSDGLTTTIGIRYIILGW